MKATEARKLVNKAKKQYGIKITMSPFHLDKIREAANRGESLVLFEDWTPHMVQGFEELGYETIIVPRFLGWFSRNLDSHLVVLW